MQDKSNLVEFLLVFKTKFNFCKSLLKHWLNWMFSFSFECLSLELHILKSNSIQTLIFKALLTRAGLSQWSFGSSFFCLDRENELGGGGSFSWPTGTEMTMIVQFECAHHTGAVCDCVRNHAGLSSDFCRLILWNRGLWSLLGWSTSYSSLFCFFTSVTRLLYFRYLVMEMQNASGKHKNSVDRRV